MKFHKQSQYWLNIFSNGWFHLKLGLTMFSYQREIVQIQNSLTGMENTTNQSCEKMIGHFPYITKNKLKGLNYCKDLNGP